AGELHRCGGTEPALPLRKGAESYPYVGWESLNRNFHFQAQLAYGLKRPAFVRERHFRWLGLEQTNLGQPNALPAQTISSSAVSCSREPRSQMRQPRRTRRHARYLFSNTRGFS